MLSTSLRHNLALAGGFAAVLVGGCTTRLAEDRDPSQGGSASPAAGGGSGYAATGGLTAMQVHRMTRLQYNNTVRDLLASRLQPANAFPQDPVISGYDNVAASLTISPQAAGLYNTAAHDLAAEATQPTPRWLRTFNGPADGPAASPDGSPLSSWGWNIRSPFTVKFTVPTEDDAIITIVAGGSALNAPTPMLNVNLDGKSLTTLPITASTNTPAPLMLTPHLGAGAHQLTLTFTNKVVDTGQQSNTDSEIGIGRIRVESKTQTTSPGQALLKTCDPAAAADPEPCYQKMATDFTARAWRRPLAHDEQQRVVALYQALVAQSDRDTAMQFVIRAALVSPQFLYLAGRADATNPNMMSDYDLANRLSYFLWSSMPDDALLAAAAQGSLRTADGMAGQLTRMLASDKIKGLADGFAAQWLATRDLASLAPDPATFPNWTADLKDDMAQETAQFFTDYLTNGQAMDQMLTSTAGFLNDRLAKHYRLPAPGSATLTKTQMPADGRHGLLGLGGWLASTSMSTRTSPVKRGRFILEHLLCRPVLPPPPGVAALPTIVDGMKITQRQLLDQHAKDPTCGGCHNTIDPPGFAMEGYDGIGQDRTLDNGLAIDATGTLDGKDFNGAMQLAPLLAASGSFVPCLARQLYGYALSRTVSDADAATLADIVQKTGQAGNRLDALIRNIVTSPAFIGVPGGST